MTVTFGNAGSNLGKFFAASKPRGLSNFNQTSVTINDLGLQAKTRTNKTSGVTKSRFTVSIDATPLTVDCDALILGKGPANAIAEHLRARIKTIAKPASPATLKRRETAAEAFARGGSVAPAKGKGAKKSREGALRTVGAYSVMEHVDLPQQV